MSRMWHHPQNDQRPAVIQWLKNTVPPGRDIIDIGAGEGYYIEAAKPATYAFVEPVQVLRMQTRLRARNAGLHARAFTRIAALRRSSIWHECNCVMLIHSLYYLSDEELELVAELALRTVAVFVYPDPSGAATVAFEDAIGDNQSRRLVALKDRLLDPPSIRLEAETHLTLPALTPDHEVAFLLSHTLQTKTWRPAIAEAALRYVRLNRASWYRPDAGWKLPQPQIMETWQR